MGKLKPQGCPRRLPRLSRRAVAEIHNLEEVMKRLIVYLVSAVTLLVLANGVQAQDLLVPAGTLLQCTMSEPNFSSATASVGDPVLCHLKSFQEFGRTVFPRGSMLAGHLEEEKDPGHFVGKGYLKITFDRVIVPTGDVPLPAKVIAAKGFKVDKQGDIKGKGHAKRDVVEWMIPPLWPWKVLMLPARGPRPTLKGEEPMQLRLMDDVTIPRVGASYNSRDNLRDWRAPATSYRPAVYYNDSREAHSPPAASAAMRNVISVDSGIPQKTALNGAPQPVETNIRQITEQASEARVPVVQAQQTRTPTSSLTLIALRNETIWAVSSYWLDGDRLGYVLPSGTRESCDLNAVDLARTTQLNAERGITVTFRATPPAEPSLSSALN